MNASQTYNAILCDDPIIEEAEKTSSLIAASRRHLAEYKLIDLGAMEARVRNLCDKVQSASNKSRENAKSIICSIIDDLNQLETEIVTRQKEIISRQNKMDQRSAAHAYDNGTGKA